MNFVTSVFKKYINKNESNSTDNGQRKQVPGESPQSTAKPQPESVNKSDEEEFQDAETNATMPELPSDPQQTISSSQHIQSLDISQQQKRLSSTSAVREPDYLDTSIIDSSDGPTDENFDESNLIDSIEIPQLVDGINDFEQALQDHKKDSKELITAECNDNIHQEKPMNEESDMQVASNLEESLQKGALEQLIRSVNETLVLNDSSPNNTLIKDVQTDLQSYKQLNHNSDTSTDSNPAKPVLNQSFKDPSQSNNSCNPTESLPKKSDEIIAESQTATHNLDKFNEKNTQKQQPTTPQETQSTADNSVIEFKDAIKTDKKAEELASDITDLIYERQETKELEKLETSSSKFVIDDILDYLVAKSTTPTHESTEEPHEKQNKLESIKIPDLHLQEIASIPLPDDDDSPLETNKTFFRQDTGEFEAIEKQCLLDVQNEKKLSKVPEENCNNVNKEVSMVKKNIEETATPVKQPCTRKVLEETNTNNQKVDPEILQRNEVKSAQSEVNQSEAILFDLMAEKFTVPQVANSESKTPVHEENKTLCRQDTHEFEIMEKQCMLEAQKEQNSDKLDIVSEILEDNISKKEDCMNKSSSSSADTVTAVQKSNKKFLEKNSLNEKSVIESKACAGENSKHDEVTIKVPVENNSEIFQKDTPSDNKARIVDTTFPSSQEISATTDTQKTKHDNQKDSENNSVKQVQENCKKTAAPVKQPSTGEVLEETNIKDNKTVSVVNKSNEVKTAQSEINQSEAILFSLMAEKFTVPQVASSESKIPVHEENITLCRQDTQEFESMEKECMLEAQKEQNSGKLDKVSEILEEDLNKKEDCVNESSSSSADTVIAVKENNKEYLQKNLMKEKSPIKSKASAGENSKHDEVTNKVHLEKKSEVFQQDKPSANKARVVDTTFHSSQELSALPIAQKTKPDDQKVSESPQVEENNLVKQENIKENAVPTKEVLKKTNKNDEKISSEIIQGNEVKSTQNQIDQSEAILLGLMAEKFTVPQVASSESKIPVHEENKTLCRQDTQEFESIEKQCMLEAQKEQNSDKLDKVTETAEENGNADIVIAVQESKKESLEKYSVNETTPTKVAVKESNNSKIEEFTNKNPVGSESKDIQEQKTSGNHTEISAPTNTQKTKNDDQEVSENPQVEKNSSVQKSSVAVVNIPKSDNDNQTSGTSKNTKSLQGFSDNTVVIVDEESSSVLSNKHDTTFEIDAKPIDSRKKPVKPQFNKNRKSETRNKAEVRPTVRTNKPIPISQNDNICKPSHEDSAAKVTINLQCEEAKSVSKMQQMLVEYEKQISIQAAELERLRNEAEMNVRHFTNTEMAFSDVFEKYEKSKAVIAVYRRNEDILLENIERAEEQLVQLESKCQAMKQQSMTEIRRAEYQVNQEKEKYKRDISKMQGQIKRLEIKASSLELALKQKNDECQALAALCDDITGRTTN